MSKLFHKSTQTAGGKAAAMRAEFTRRLVLLCLAVAVSSLAVTAYISTAWFAKNEQVGSSGNTINSQSATASLHIRRYGENDKDYLSFVSQTAAEGPGLFPSSTGDLQNWWYACEFTYKDANDAPVPAYASRYAEIEAEAAEGNDFVYTYTNTYEGDNAANAQKHVAYYASKLNLYTTPNTELDVYFDPAAPISVAYSRELDNGETERMLLNALRVGVLVDNPEPNADTVIIYAPAEEAGTTTFKCVTDATTVGDLSVVTDWTVGAGYVAEAVSGQSDSYQVNEGQTPLGRANSTDGLDVTVFIWLEGTDAEAEVGVSDDDTRGINVSVSFVGVAAS